MKPSGGSGVAAVIPAFSIAFVFAQNRWPSQCRTTMGRSVVLSRSRSCRVSACGVVPSSSVIASLKR